MEHKKVKILSLDGGGSWAILQAMALKAIYGDTPVGTNCRSILNQFDVVSANSGGSLMLAAMVEHADNDIDKVIDMFLDGNARGSIFSGLRTGERSLLEWVLKKALRIGPRYKSGRKIDGFLKALPQTGNMQMHRINSELGINPQLVICGFDYDMMRAVFFKSKQWKPDTYRLADAINAASNAPINYFNEPVAFNYDGQSHRFWDGAVGGNNNPVLIGITEALSLVDGCPLDAEHMKVLSIGTGNNLIPIKGFTQSDRAQDKRLVREKARAGITGDIPRMSQSILSEPPDAANFMAHMFLGGRNESQAKASVIRMNPLIQPCLVNDVWTLPDGVDPDTFFKLVALDMDAVDQKEVQLISQLGNWWLADQIANQGIRYNGLNFKVSIGHSSFSSAKKEWLRRCGL